MTKLSQQQHVSSFGRNLAAACFGAFLFIMGLITGPRFPTPPSFSKPVAAPAAPRAALNPDAMELINVRRRASPGNESCVVVGCHTPNTPGADSYWAYYSRSHYAFAFYAIDMVMHNGRRASDKWCDVPAARDELRLRPRSKVIFVDVDTKIDVRAWCNVPDHHAAPLVVNSLTRGPAKKSVDGYFVEGTQIQTNVFRATAGDAGLSAMKRWEDNFNRGTLSDQGALHQHENGLCGIPGWVACYNNPEQQGCHCFGSGNRPGKVNCIAMLFNGTLSRCVLKV